MFCWYLITKYIWLSTPLINIFGGVFMTLPEGLKRMRNSSGLPQSKIAKMAEVSTTQYQNYEYGKNEPTASVLIRLADFFDVSLDFLVGRSDDPKRR